MTNKLLKAASAIQDNDSINLREEQEDQALVDDCDPDELELGNICDSLQESMHI